MQEFGRLRVVYQEQHVTAFFPISELENIFSFTSYLSVHVNPSNALENKSE